MSGSGFFAKGEWNAICQVCGFQRKSSTMRRRWDGKMVCEQDWEPRHPQEFIKPAGPDPKPLPWTSPEPPDQFLNPGDVTPGNVS